MRSCWGPHDYVRKNGFSEVVVGLSGGIDSSLVAVIAADALGAGSVHGVSMPSRYTSDESNDDAAELSSRLGIDYLTVPIEPAHKPCSKCCRHIRRRRSRLGRGKYPEPVERAGTDGAVEQVRLARPDDRQQKRVGGRLSRRFTETRRAVLP